MLYAAPPRRPYRQTASRPCLGSSAPKQRPMRQWHMGERGLRKKTRVLRTMLGREKQGFSYAGGFLEPVPFALQSIEGNCSVGLFESTNKRLFI